MLKTQKITLKNRKGHELSANLIEPLGGNPHAYALFAHCFTCTQRSRAAIDISRSLAQKGIATLRFDFTGLGESEGDFAHTTFSSDVDDIVDVAHYLRDNYKAPSLLIGHSLGGAAVLAAAGEIETIKAVATIGAPSTPLHLIHHFDDHLEEIEREGKAEVSLAGRKFTITKEFLEDLKTRDIQGSIKNMNRALMVFHAPQDQVVSIDNAAEIFTLAKHPKSFVSLDDADHLVSRLEDGQYVATVLSGWASKYVCKKEASIEGDNALRATTGKNGFTTDIRVRQHALIGDEPKNYGGDDLGPTPYDFLAAGLGSCTSITLRMYANKKKIPLDRVTVKVDHNKVHVTDCEDCGEAGKYLDTFTREIELEGELTDEQKERLIQIADRCPVHKTLSHEAIIETKSRS